MQRQAEFVVQIALGFQYAEPRGQQRRQNFLCCGLSSRPGDRCQPPPPSRSNGLREPLERGERVGNRKKFCADRLGISRQALRRHDGRQCASVERRDDVVVSIVTRPVYRDEQFATSHGPRINRDTGHPGQAVETSGWRNSQSASHFFNRPPHSVLKGLGLTGLVSPLDQRPLHAKNARLCRSLALSNGPRHVSVQL